MEFGVTSPSVFDGHNLIQLIPDFLGICVTSNVRVGQLVSIVSILRDSVESQGREVAKRPVVASTGEITGVWEGAVADDLFSGNWSFRLPEISLSSEYNLLSRKIGFRVSPETVD